MINEKIVDNIRVCARKDSWEGRHRVLVEDIGFRIGEKAEYVIITGCIPPEGCHARAGSAESVKI